MDHFIKVHLLKDILSIFNLAKQLSKLRPSASLQTILLSLTLEEKFFFFFQFEIVPVIGASGRDCSFLHAGTNTVISLWPLSRNQSTASCIPLQENSSLFPWLQKQ